jgi:hypothetical protein
MELEKKLFELVKDTNNFNSLIIICNRLNLYLPKELWIYIYEKFIDFNMNIPFLKYIKKIYFYNPEFYNISTTLSNKQQYENIIYLVKNKIINEPIIGLQCKDNLIENIKKLKDSGVIEGFLPIFSNYTNEQLEKVLELKKTINNEFIIKEIFDNNYNIDIIEKIKKFNPETSIYKYFMKIKFSYLDYNNTLLSIRYIMDKLDNIESKNLKSYYIYILFEFIYKYDKYIICSHKNFQQKTLNQCVFLKNEFNETKYIDENIRKKSIIIFEKLYEKINTFIQLKPIITINHTSPFKSS